MSKPTTSITLTLKIEDLVAQYLKAGRWADTNEEWVVRASDYLLDPHKQIIQITATVDEPTQKK